MRARTYDEAEAVYQASRDLVLAEAGLPPGFVFGPGLTVVNAGGASETCVQEGENDTILGMRRIEAVQPHVRERYRRGQW